MDTRTDAERVRERKRALREDAPLHPRGDLLAWQVTVVFSPHPDDESLGCGGLIATLRDLEREVHVVFVTDGGMSHPNSARYPRAARAALREGEARAACRVLGVPDTHVHFLGLPDGAVPTEGMPEFRDSVATIVGQLSAWHAATVVVPFRRDLHPDHRLVWAICRAAVDAYRHDIRWVEYPVWMWEATDPDDLPREDELIAWRLEVANQLPRKEAAIRAHASQVGGVIDDDPTGFRLAEPMLEHFRQPFEVFFEETAKRHSSLSGAYFEAVYRKSEDPWQFETSPYESKKYAATVAALPETHYPRALEIGCSIGVLTAQLAPYCGQLIAVDTSAVALQRARQRLEANRGVVFRQLSIPQDFPEGHFDLVVLSEVGYYWGYADLALAVAKIRAALLGGGTLVLVHYTPYVPDYPLTGDEVHEAFAESLTRDFYRVRSERAERYRLDVWKHHHPAQRA